MITGQVPFTVDDQVRKPFSAPGTLVTLYNLGPADAWTSTRPNVGVGRGVPLPAGGAVQWDADKECYAVCAPGSSTTLLASDNSSAPGVGS